MPGTRFRMQGLNEREEAGSQLGMQGLNEREEAGSQLSMHGLNEREEAGSQLSMHGLNEREWTSARHDFRCHSDRVGLDIPAAVGISGDLLILAGVMQWTDEKRDCVSNGAYARNIHQCCPYVL